MKQIGQLLSAITWILVVGSVVVLAGGLFGRPLLLAAVPTGSMVPTLNPGDLIVVLPTWAVHSAGLDDIIVFKTEDHTSWIVHRIVDGNGAEGFVTKGDANPSADASRVFPRDIAGVVPRFSGEALRLPRLGLLSVSQGPLSSPVVAGVALVMGVYLLVLDVQPKAKALKLRVRWGPQAEPGQVLAMYLGLAGTAFVTTLIPAWTLSTSQRISYEVVETRPVNVRVSYQYVHGVPQVEDLPINNPSPLPVVVVFDTDDPAVSYEPSWALIPPRAQKVIRATVNNPEIGKHSSRMSSGVFLPLLPPGLIAKLAQVNMVLTAIVLALVPAGVMLGFAFCDRRARMAIERWRRRLWLHMSV